MKKFNINEEESRRILSLHSQVKQNTRLFTEQVSEAELQTYIDTGCITNGEIESLPLTNGKEMMVIKKPTANKTYYFLPDFRYGYFENNKFVYADNKWKCPSDWSTRKEIDQLKREQNWKERKELNVSDADLSNTSKWETKKVGNVTLYRMIGGITATKELGADAQAILDSLEKTGWSTSDKTPANKRVGGVRLSSLRPDWKQYFSDDLILYPNPNAVARSKNQTPEDMDDIQKFTQSLKNLTIDGCKTEIEEFFNLHNYKVTSGIDPFEIAKRKRTIEYCSKKFDFNNIFYAKTRNKLLTLGGISKNNIPGASRESPYRIDLPGKYLNN